MMRIYRTHTGEILVEFKRLFPQEGTRAQIEEEDEFRLA